MNTCPPYNFRVPSKTYCWTRKIREKTKFLYKSLMDSVLHMPFGEPRPTDLHYFLPKDTGIGAINNLTIIIWGQSDIEKAVITFWYPSRLFAKDT